MTTLPGDYLLHHLLTRTSTPPAVADEVAAGAGMVLATAKDLALGFAESFPPLSLLERYYNGDPPLPREPRRMTDKFRELMLAARSNWCGLVVDVVSERLQIGSVTSTRNPVQDKTLWNWWQANNMDGQSQQIHTTALKLGLCYVSVWPGEDGTPKIMGESPLSCYADFDLETGECLGALRLWFSPREALIYADLTLPEWQFRLVSTNKAIAASHVDPSTFLMYQGIDMNAVEWTFREDTDPIRVNTLGRVPYARMRTMPDLMGGYRSEIDGVRPIQDRINRTNFDRLVTQEYAAFPQRWVTGVEIEDDPATGEPKNPFTAAQDRIWTLSDPAGAFGQFAVADLGNYLQAVTHDVQALATQSRTPPHYLVAGMGQFPSGESVRATEYGLTRKIQARQQSYGDTWSEVLRLAAAQAGKPVLAADNKVSVVWENVEARSEGEIVDALLKMGTLGVPAPALWQRWGASPEEITAWQAEVAAAQAAIEAALPPPTQPAPPAPLVS